MNWKSKCLANAKALSWEKRQEFLDLIRSNITIGEATTKAGITFDEANGIIMMNLNIKNISYLNTTTL